MMNIFGNIFSKSKKKEELVLVFDIGSHSVGGAYLQMGENQIPKIIFSVREPISLEKDITTSRFLDLTLRSLDVVATKLHKHIVGVPTRVFCVLSCPWYASQVRHIKIEKNTPFIFTSKLADSLITKEIGLFEEEYLKKYADIGNTVRSIELKNMKTLLNGYATPFPFDQKAKNLEMVIFISMSGEDVLFKIEEVISHYFHFDKIKFSSFAMASFTVARDISINQPDFLLVDIGGEMTDISMIKKDILQESISFPLGSNFMVRGISSAFDFSFDEARAYFSLYKDGHLVENILKKFEPVIENLKKEWLSKFQESLVNISNDISIPSTIFLTIDADFSDFFCSIIKTEQFNQYTLTDSKFNICFLNNQALHGNIVEKSQKRDPFITIESIYINRFLR